MLEKSTELPGLTSPAAAAASRRPAQVWLFQLILQHYRLRVWDRIVELGGDDYSLTVFGPLVNGEVTGGGIRPYIRHNDSRWFKLLGMQFADWPQSAEMVRSERPDLVIVTGNTRELSCWSLPVLCRRLGIGAMSWGKVHGYSGVSELLMRPIKRRFFRRFDAHIVYGRQSKEELTSLGVPAATIHIAQNTIDTEFIFSQRAEIELRACQLRSAMGFSADDTLLVCVGRMIEKKRQVDLLRVWTSLCNKHPTLRLVFVGEGPMFEALHAQAHTLDAKRIFFTGRVPEGDDVAWLAAADLAVMPGAIGLAINASMAVGTPTIIADEYGSDSEILEHNITGWRYRRGDSAALLASIDNVLAGGPLIHEVTERAQRMLREQITIQNMAGGVDSAIRHALSIREAAQVRGATCG